MVIMGSSAPKCQTKPKNPTSSTLVGTMVGSNENKNNPKKEKWIKEKKDKEKRKRDLINFKMVALNMKTLMVSS